MAARNPLRKVLDNLCTQSGTEKTAWNYYKNLKKIRTGDRDSDVLPKGYMSICAFLAAERTSNNDVDLKDVYNKTGLKSDAQFWRNFDEVESILELASADSTPPRLHYVRLPSFDQPCAHCKDHGLRCYRMPSFDGKRASKKCMSCYHTHRPGCSPNRSEDADSDDDPQWTPPTKKKTLDDRLNRIEQRAEQQVQKKTAKRTECPKLPPFTRNPPTGSPQHPSSSTTARPSAVSLSASAPSALSSARPEPDPRPSVFQASPSDLPSKIKPLQTEATVVLSAGPSRRPGNKESCEPQRPRQSSTAGGMPLGDKGPSGPSLQAFRRPGPGRSSQGLVEPGRTAEPSHSPGEKPSAASSPVVGQSSQTPPIHQPSPQCGPIKEERQSGGSSRGGRRQSPISAVTPSAAQAPAHPMPSIKKERSASGSGSTHGSSKNAPSRRPSASQAQAQTQARAAHSSLTPQRCRPEVPNFSFTALGNGKGYGSIDIPMILEPALDPEPESVPRPSSRGRLFASPKTMSPVGEANDTSQSAGKRPSEDAGTQTRKKRKTNVVNARSAGLPETSPPTKIAPTPSTPSGPGTQPTPPHSRKHTPVAGGSAARPSSPSSVQTYLPPTPTSAPAQPTRRVEQYSSASRGQTPSRLPTPISPPSRSAMLPIPESLVSYPEARRRDEPRHLREVSPRRPPDPCSLPTPRSSLSVPVFTPPLPPSGSPELALCPTEQDVVMQDANAPSPASPSESQSPRLPSWAPNAVSPPPPSSTSILTPSPTVLALPLLQVSGPAHTATPLSAPAHTSTTPPTPAHASTSAPAPAPPSTPPMYAQYLQLVYRKAKEIVEHVGANECAPLDLSFAISDMSTRVAKFDGLRQRGADEKGVKTLGKMLLRAGEAVVEAWQEMLQQGVKLEDEALDTYVEELKGRLEKMNGCV